MANNPVLDKQIGERKKGNDALYEKLLQEQETLELNEVTVGTMEDHKDMSHPEYETSPIQFPALRYATNNPDGIIGHTIEMSPDTASVVLGISPREYTSNREKLKGAEAHVLVVDIPDVGRVIQILRPAGYKMHPVQDGLAMSVGRAVYGSGKGKDKRPKSKTTLALFGFDGVSNTPKRKEDVLADPNLIVDSVRSDGLVDVISESHLTVHECLRYSADAVQMAVVEDKKGNSCHPIGLKNVAARLLNEVPAKVEGAEGYATAQLITITIDDAYPDEIEAEVIGLGSEKNLTDGVHILTAGPDQALTESDLIYFVPRTVLKQPDTSKQNNVYPSHNSKAPESAGEIRSSTGDRRVEDLETFEHEFTDEDGQYGYVPYLDRPANQPPEEYLDYLPKDMVVVQTSDGARLKPGYAAVVSMLRNSELAEVVKTAGSKDFLDQIIQSDGDDGFIQIFIRESLLDEKISLQTLKNAEKSAPTNEAQQEALSQIQALEDRINTVLGTVASAESRMLEIEQLRLEVTSAQRAISIHEAELEKSRTTLPLIQGLAQAVKAVFNPRTKYATKPQRNGLAKSHQLLISSLQEELDLLENLDSESTRIEQGEQWLSQNAESIRVLSTARTRFDEAITPVRSILSEEGRTELIASLRNSYTLEASARDIQSISAQENSTGDEAIIFLQRLISPDSLPAEQRTHNMGTLRVLNFQTVADVLSRLEQAGVLTTDEDLIAALGQVIQKGGSLELEFMKQILPQIRRNIHLNIGEREFASILANINNEEALSVLQKDVQLPYQRIIQECSTNVIRVSREVSQALTQTEDLASARIVVPDISKKK